jgi:hypothetical protein
MKHLKYLLMLALVAMPLTACDEDDDDEVVDVPVVGTVAGTVSAEGSGLAGVSVTLSGAQTLSATTDASGAYSFTNVEAGSYGVSIDASNHSDVTFPQTAKSTAITTQGQTATVDFSGNYIRTASITGTVIAGSQAVAGVTVTVTGGPDNVTKTDDTDLGGDFSISGLRGGDYTVTLSDVPANFNFAQMAKDISVETGGQGSATFVGTELEEAVITGFVLASGDGVGGVTVTLSGGADATETTNAAGEFTFDELDPGSYTVTISGWNEEEYAFDVTELSADVDYGDVEELVFSGDFIQKASISIQSITKGGTNLPVDLDDVFGQVDVSLNLKANDLTVTQVDVLVDGEIAASQTFAAAELAQMAEEGPEGQEVEIITLSFNTARYDVDMENYTATARYENGPHTIGAQVHVEEIETPTAANTIEVEFNNDNTFHVLASREGLDTATDAGDLLWYGGPDFELMVYPIPVMYNGQVVTSMTAGLANEGGTGSCGSQTDSSAPFGFTWDADDCGGVEATGMLPTVTSTVTDANENGPTSGFGAALNIANVTKAADHPFPMRIDVWAPQGGSIVVIQQDDILNVDNWVNDEYSFTHEDAYTAPTDGGVGGVTRVRTEVIDLLDDDAVVWSSQTGIDDLEESVTNEEYQVRAVVRDALSNSRTISQSENDPNHPKTTFGYDVTEPLVDFSDEASEVGNLTEQTTIFENFAPGDNVRAVATDNLAGFNDATGVSHSIVWIRGAFQGEGDIQTDRVVSAPGGPDIAAEPFAAATAGERVVEPVLVTPPNVDYVLQTKVNVAVNNLGSVIAGEMGESAPPARYYIYQIEVRDQAGNVIRDYRTIYVNNNGMPRVQNLSNPTAFDATAAFMASLTRDSVEVLEGSLELRYPNTLGTIVWERPTADIVSTLRMNADLPDGVLFNDIIYRPANDVTFPLGFDALGVPFLKSVQTTDVASVNTAKPDSVRVRVFNGFGADNDALNHSTAPLLGGSGYSALISNPIQDEELDDPTTLYHSLPITSYEIVKGDDPGVEDCDAQYCVRAIGPKSTFSNPFEGGPVLVAWAQADESGDYTGVDNEIQWRVAAVATANFDNPFPTRDSGDDRLYEWTFDLPGDVPTERLDLAAIGINGTTGDGLLTTRLFVPTFNVNFDAASYSADVGEGAVTMDLEHGANSTGGGFAVDECVFLDNAGDPRLFPPTGLTVTTGAESCVVTVGADAEAGEYMVRATASQSGATDTATGQLVVVAPTFDITLSGSSTVDIPLAGDGNADYDFDVDPVAPTGPISDLLCSIDPDDTSVAVAPVDLGGGDWVCRVTVPEGETEETYTISAAGQEEGTGAEATDTFTFSTEQTWDVSVTPDPDTLSWSATTEFTVNYSGDYGVGDVAGGITCSIDAAFLDASPDGDGECEVTVDDYSTAVAGTYTLTVDGSFGAPDTFSRTATAVLLERPLFDPVVDIQTSPQNRREIERDRTANFVVVSGEGLGIDVTGPGASTAVVSPSDGNVTASVIEDADGTFIVEVVVADNADTGNYTVTVEYVEEISGDTVEKEMFIRVLDTGAEAPGGGGG